MISRVRNRDIVTSVILTVITCGFYGFYWLSELTDDCGDASGDHSISGGMSVLLWLITCGIYSWYWSYQMGKRIRVAQEKRHLPVTDNSTLYLIFSIFKLDIVNWILLQSDLNQLAEFDQQNG